MARSTCLILCGLAAAVYGQTPSVSRVSDDLVLSATSGDVKISTSGMTCPSGGCGLGETLSSLQNAIATLNATLMQLQGTAALSADVAATYLTQSAAASTYATNVTLQAYDTVNTAVARDDATRIYALNLVEELANYTNVTEYDAIVAAHQHLGFLDGNGTFTGDININGDLQLASMLPLINHVVHVTGSVIVQNIRIQQNLTGLFGRLMTVREDVSIQNSQGFTSLGVAFPALTTVGGRIQLYQLYAVTSLDGAFPMATSIGNLRLYRLTAYRATTVGTMLPRLASVAGRSLGPNFNPTTMIFVGDYYLYPGNHQDRGTFAEAITDLAQTRIITGQLYIRRQSSSSVRSLDGFCPNLYAIGSQLYFYDNDGITNMTNAFPQLTQIGGSLTIFSISNLQVFGNAFPQLRMIYGNLHWRYSSNGRFISMAGIFPSLTNVTGHLQLYNNEYVQTVAGAFPALTWVNGQIRFYYMRRVQIHAGAFPVLEFAKGVRFDNSFQYSGTARNQVLDGAFPQLLRLGTDGLYMNNNYYLRSMTGAFPRVWRNDGVFFINNCRNMPVLSGVMNSLVQQQNWMQINNNQNLRNITNCFTANSILNSYMYINGNRQLTTIHNSFNVTYIDSNFYLINNNVLNDVSTSFTSLVEIDDYVQFYRNYLLLTLGQAFGNLVETGRLNWYGQSGGSQSSSASGQQTWCNNVKAILCPTTDLYSNARWAYDADSCCLPFCASSALC